MINIYVSEDRISKCDIVKWNDEEFDMNMSKTSMDETDVELMKKIDKVSMHMKGVIETPFGLTDIYHLSTGCKTAINVNHAVKNKKFDRVFDISECGPNAIREIFKIIDGTPMRVLLKHRFMDMYEDYVYNVNCEEKISSIMDLKAMIGGN